MSNGLSGKDVIMWPNLIHYPNACLKGMTKVTKKPHNSRHLNVGHPKYAAGVPVPLLQRQILRTQKAAFLLAS